MARPIPRAKPVPTPEEWAAWCAHPVSEWVAAVFEAKANECRDAWLRQSWAAGDANPALLVELRTRADNFRAFLDSNWKDYAATKTS